MKHKLLLTLAILLVTVFQHIHAQKVEKWGGDMKNGIWRLYSINANIGALSYFGDLSRYDTEPLKKLRHESRPAFSVTMTKYILNKFGVSGQVLFGQLKGAGSTQEFSSSILEYNLHLRADLVRLIFPAREHRIGFSPYAGIGQFIFNTTTTAIKDDVSTTSKVQSRVPEFVYFAGGSLSYKLPANLAVTADLALRQCRNDKLDGVIKNDNFDYYSYFSFGVSYRINSITRQPVKNKARLAHNEPFLSHKKRIRSY